jgi:hypothetical protein
MWIESPVIARQLAGASCRADGAKRLDAIMAGCTNADDVRWVVGCFGRAWSHPAIVRNSKRLAERAIAASDTALLEMVATQAATDSFAAGAVAEAFDDESALTAPGLLEAAQEALEAAPFRCRKALVRRAVRSMNAHALDTASQVMQNPHIVLRRMAFKYKDHACWELFGWLTGYNEDRAAPESTGSSLREQAPG